MGREGGLQVCVVDSAVSEIGPWAAHVVEPAGCLICVTLFVWKTKIKGLLVLLWPRIAGAALPERAHFIIL